MIDPSWVLNVAEFRGAVNISYNVQSIAERSGAVSVSALLSEQYRRSLGENSDVPTLLTEGQTQAHSVGRLVGPLQFLSRLVEIWRLDDENGSVLLGIDANEYRQLMIGAKSLKGIDQEDRIRTLLKIRAALKALFQNEEQENEWLRSRNPELNSDAPLDVMLCGHFTDLVRVEELVARISGR